MLICTSPNFGGRRDGLQPELVVLHYTAMRSAEAALARLCDPVAEVSSHYLIGRDGTIWRLVDEADRAWHAGAGVWRGRGDVNSRSIGIEIDNDGQSPFSAAAMLALEALLPGIMARWDIGPAGVIGHADMAPGRKADPGPRFDWRRIARAGLSVWPEAALPEGDLTDCLAALGYGCVAVEATLAAFRDRFRPGATGPADRIDLALARGLIGQMAVDGADRLA